MELAMKIALVCLMIVQAEGAKILLITPMVPGMYSHVTQMATLGQGLVKKGHKVSWLVPDTPRVWPSIHEKPFHQILYNVNQTDFETADALSNKLVEVTLKNPNAMREPMEVISAIIGRFYNHLFNDTRMLREVEMGRFDLAILDNFFLHGHAYLLPAKLGIPFASLVDIVDPWMAAAPWLPSFVPHGLLAYSDRMTFLERLGNTLFSVAWTTFPSLFYNIPVDAGIVKTYTDDIPEFTSIHHLVAQSKLWLITTNDYVDYVKPMMANMVNIGGHHTKPARELTGELAEFVESATEGVILVSFGSAVDKFPPHILEAFLLVFSQIPQKIVWRLNPRTVEQVPPNVMLFDWIPQNDLLGHRNVKLFITHCGRNGQFEALYHGKPAVAVPIQGEQIYNAVRFVAKGFAVRLDIRTLTAEDLLVAITEVLENPVYARNIAKASEMFRSQLNHPLDVATHWIEHVIKYGDRHLRSHALDMPWYQYHMVDVFGALVGVFALSGFMLWVLLKLCRVRFLAVGVLVTVVIGVTVKLLL